MGMKAEINKKYLYTDMDQTLIDDNKKISRENLDAIQRFVTAGGKFSVASGRNVDITRPFLDILPINAPAILYNGAGVYDFAQERFLHKEGLDPKLAADILHLAHAVYPDGCLQTFHEGPIRLYNRIGTMDHYIEAENQPFTFFSLGARCEDAMKAMVYGDHTQLEKVRVAVLQAFGEKGFRWTYSQPFYLEFLPPACTKGSALRWIENHLGISRNDVAAIGDYYNDVELLEAASLGAAVANAPADIRSKADVVVCDNNHHALADLIDHYLLADH